MIFKNMNSIVNLIRYHGLITPDSKAIKSKLWCISYAQLVNVIEALKFALLEKGVAEGMSVSVSMESERFNTFLISLALLDLGCDYVAGSAYKDNAVIPDLLVTDALTQVPIKQILFDSSWFDKTRIDDNIKYHQSMSGVVFFGTSGSVGVRKVVELSQQHLLMRVQSHSLCLSHTVITRNWGSLIGPDSLFGYLAFLSPLMRGGTLVLNSGSVVEKNNNLDAIEHLVLSPQILALFLENENVKQNTFQELKSIMISGSATPQVLLQKVFSSLTREVFSSYGSTEVGPVASIQFRPDIDMQDAVGYVYPWIELEIMDGDKPIKDGEEGLIRIRSPYMVNQYHDNRVSTEKSYKDGWFYPGDLGRLREGRLLEVTGRVNEVINIGGLKIAPHRIEHFVRSQTFIRDAAAFSNPSESGVEEVWLAIVTSGPVDFVKLHQKCVEQFGMVAAPVRILHVTSIPRTDNGKIRRATLKALLTQDSNLAQTAI